MWEIFFRLRDGESLQAMAFRKFAKAILELAGTFGFHDQSLTPYCVRRGGATWHFTTYQCYDSTQALGRWANAKTARLYINQATSEVGLLSLPTWGKRRVARGVATVSTLVERA